MVSIRGQYCIDRYEAYVAIMLPKGKLRRHSAYKAVTATNIKALNRKGRMPQGYISQRKAALACRNAGKRLCTGAEWIKACKGKKPTVWPYGKKHKPGRCNDRGTSSMNKLFGRGGKGAQDEQFNHKNMNDPRHNKMRGTVKPSGKFRRCRNSYRVYDMVGNVHEWTASPRGTFRGGYFLDVHKNGHGCDYKTTAHNTRYHDYSTGFRCCK